MAIWGKVIGGTFGLGVGGPVGAVVGFLAGHPVDRAARQQRRRSDPDQVRAEQAFFTTTFRIMGHVAKADGRVSPAEVAAAERVIRRMRLDPEQRRAAIDLFSEGKRRAFPLDETLRTLRMDCQGRPDLLRRFLECQLRMALADGTIQTSQEQILEHIFRSLGLSQRELDWLILVLAGPRTAFGRYRERVARRPRNELAEAYAVLGVDEEASDAEIKLAYRRLMRRYHPDKHMAAATSPELMEQAKRRVQEIGDAYRRIVHARGRS